MTGLEANIDELGKTALRIKAGRDGLLVAGLQLAVTAADYAKLIHIEHFNVTDIAVTSAYERLRLALEAFHAAAEKAAS